MSHVITEFAIPSGSQPWGITTGPDGNLWFAQKDGNSHGAIGTFSLATHSFTMFPTTGVGPTGITVGSDGNLWFTEYSGRIGEINPTSHVINEFPVPISGGVPYDITSGRDGNLWFTVASANPPGGPLLGQINPSTDAINVFPLSSATLRLWDHDRSRWQSLVRGQPTRQGQPVNRRNHPVSDHGHPGDHDRSGCRQSSRSPPAPTSSSRH